jgi:hypothetical protein
MDSDFRPLKPAERALLEKLLDCEFPGRDELRRQLDSVAAQQVYDDGTLALRVASGQPAAVKGRVPTEGMCPDVDGVMIAVLLHVVNGMMDELEIFKWDGSDIVRPPAAAELVLCHPIDIGTLTLTSDAHPKIRGAKIQLPKVRGDIT